MGVFKRKDSKYWYLFDEKTKERVRTDILVGETITQRRDSQQLAKALHFERMHDHNKRQHLPVERPAIRFAKYAETYQVNIIAHRKGKAREAEILQHLVAYFGRLLLTQIDQDGVRQYWTARKRATPAPGPNCINREVDVLKSMLRDAAPKYLEASPLRGMPRLKVAAPRRRYTSPEEFARLLAVCTDAQDRGILILGRDGLARLGDLLDLKHTDRDGQMFWVGDPKVAAYEFALSPRGAAVADALATNGSIYLFPKFRRAEDPRDWPGSVRQRLEYLCKQAGIPYGRKQHGVTFHWATRRSGATDLVVKQHQPLATVQAQGGWRKPETLIGIYNEARREDKLALFGRTITDTNRETA